MNEHTTNPPPPASPPPPAPPPMLPMPHQPKLTTYFLSFAGPIQHPASKNLRNVFCNVVNAGAKEIYMLFSSGGGDVLEAFSLHNFLRALPIKLTMHCVGSVDSAAVAVFLAGTERFCCPDSTFLFHDFATNFPAPGNVSRVQFSELHATSEGFRRRSEELLKSRATFTDEDFKTLKLYDKVNIQDAAFAKKMGIVQDIKEAAILEGFAVANVDY